MTFQSRLNPHQLVLDVQYVGMHLIRLSKGSRLLVFQRGQ